MAPETDKNNMKLYNKLKVLQKDPFQLPSTNFLDYGANAKKFIEDLLNIWQNCIWPKIEIQLTFTR